MSSPAISEDVDTGIIKIASIMEELGVGSVVITAESKPAGIITERDIALKVLLKNKNLLPSTLVVLSIQRGTLLENRQR